MCGANGSDQKGLHHEYLRYLCCSAKAIPHLLPFVIVHLDTWNQQAVPLKRTVHQAKHDTVSKRGTVSPNQEYGMQANDTNRANSVKSQQKNKITGVSAIAQ